MKSFIIRLKVYTTKPSDQFIRILVIAIIRDNNDARIPAYDQALHALLYQTKDKLYQKKLMVEVFLFINFTALYLHITKHTHTTNTHSRIIE